jgi:hypothetical protein
MQDQSNRWEKSMPKKTKMEPGPHVLVGFGRHDLIDLLAEADTPEGEERLLYAIDKYHWPPRYRKATSCTLEEVYTFKEYVKWVQTKLNKGVKDVPEST